MRSLRFGAELYEEGWWPFPNLPMVVDSGLLENEIGVECRSTSQWIQEAFAWWNNLSPESQKPVRFAKEEQVVLTRNKSNGGVLCGHDTSGRV